MRNCAIWLECASWNSSLPDGATVRDLLEQLYAERPALGAHDNSILIGAGLEFVDRNYKLNPDEEIAIMPPVQGG